MHWSHSLWLNDEQKAQLVMIDKYNNMIAEAEAHIDGLRYQLKKFDEEFERSVSKTYTPAIVQRIKSQHNGSN